MSYEKQVWSKYDDLKPEEENIENGAVVTDNRMNHIEEGIEDSSSTLEIHVSNKANPHAVTKTQVGLGNVDNVQQAAKTDFDAHVANTSNPHGVTKDQIGLDKVSNVEQASKSNFDSHVSNINNPHGVTASQVGSYTKSEVAALISSAITQSKLDANPVGSIITTINDINPSTYLGGTWMRFSQGRTLVGVDEKDDVTLMKTANNMGGSVNPLTEHKHSSSLGEYAISTKGVVGWSSASTPTTSYAINTASSTAGTGDNSNHNNWQPFMTVYFWRRTA